MGSSPSPNSDREMKMERQEQSALHLQLVPEDGDGEEEQPITVEEAMACLPSIMGEDLRVLIKVKPPWRGMLTPKVDIIVGTQNLSDTFDWDLDSDVTPEEFASLHVKELGLSGEFA